MKKSATTFFVKYVLNCSQLADFHYALHVQKQTILSWRALVRPDGWIFQPRSTEKKIEAPTPEAQTIILPPNDAGISSTKVRRFFEEHKDLYFKEKINPEDLDSQDLTEEETLAILQRGIYLNENSSNNIKGAFSVAKSLFKSGLFKIQEWTHTARIVKRFVTYFRRDKSITSFKIPGSELKILGYLGNGMEANVYKVEIDAKYYPLKISNGRPNSAPSILSAVILQKWLLEHLQMNVPSVYEYDPKGEWMLSEYIEGMTLEKHLQKKLPFSRDLMRSFEELYNSAAEFTEGNNMIFDFAPDNIIIREDKAYLVDLGPGLGFNLAKTFEEFKSRLGIPNEPITATTKTTSKSPLKNRCSDIF